MNDAVQFIKSRLTAVPVPPNEGMTEEQIYEQQQQTQRRARERQEKMEKLKRKKTEEEEDEDSDYRASRIEDEDEDYQTPYANEEQREKPQESRFMKIKNVVHEKMDSAGEAIKAGGERAYERSKQGTAEFVKDVKSDFNKALQHKPQQRYRRSARSAKPLVSQEARERSAAFAIRDYERRHTPKPTNSGFSLSDDNNPSQNPYIGFSDMTGFGELDRGAFSLDANQFGFSLIGDSGMFHGQQFANEQPFSGFNVKQEHSFNVGYSGEFGAFKHSKNESYSFLPKPPHPPKNPHKRKTVKRKNQTRDFDISRLIF